MSSSTSPGQPPESADVRATGQVPSTNLYDYHAHEGWHVPDFGEGDDLLESGNTTERQPASGTEDCQDVLEAGAPSDANVRDQTAPAGQVEQLTDDLRRVQADFANFRKRAERDFDAAHTEAVRRALTALLPVVDDVDRAREHGDLTGPLRAVAAKLDAAIEQLGARRFSDIGVPFDPRFHEALVSDSATAAVTAEQIRVTRVFQCGYVLGDTVVRPARVAVSSQ